MENNISLNECFELQLTEVEMLGSMYPSSEEFSVSYPSVLTDMKKYISENSPYLPSQLDFTLNLKISDKKEILELNVYFPHKYPFSKPEACIRSLALTRSQQKQLNTDMLEYIQSLPYGELCVISLVNWLTENTGGYSTLTSAQNDEKCSKESKNADNKDVLCRMWIYSHHIYNKFKRREIVDYGQDLNLTGFSLPGKPGFVCVEGWKKDCNEFLQHMKQMSWKKLSLVKEEIGDSDDEDIEGFRKFQDFSEISFQVRRGPAKEYHMDMGQFLKFLTEHNCAYAFQDLFGLEGQMSSER